MKFALPIFTLAVAAILTMPQSLFAVRSNDFTKANSSFSKKFTSERSSAFSERSRFNDKSFEKKEFATPDNAGWLCDKQFAKPDDTLVKELSSEKSHDNGKTFDRIPEYTPKKDEWYKADTELKFDNSNRNLGKKYEGRIDFENRPDFYGEKFMQEHYGEMMEMSMQDINKYYFRSSRSSDPGIPSATAGGDLHPAAEDSIFDFLSRDKKINRPSVSLKGPAKNALDSSSVPTRKVDVASEGHSPASADFARGAPDYDSRTPRNAGKLASDAQRRSAPAAYPSVSTSPQGHEVIRQDVEQKVIDSFDFMRVPEGWQVGTPQIKVEVRDE